MDFTADIKLECADDLVAAIVDCKSQLLEEFKKKFKLVRADVETCNVYVGVKNLELLKKHELWSPAQDPEVDTTIPSYRRYIKPDGIDLVADFSLFRLHVSPIMDNNVRIVCHITAPSIDSRQMWYGNLVVLS